MFLANKLNKGAGAPTPKDAQFNYVTMLLHGDGTNGAQNNTFLDSSTNNFTITRNGNATQGSFSPYGSNWSNYFNGSTDTLDVPTSANNSVGTGSFCFEAFIYMENASAQQFLVANASSGGLFIGFNIDSANKLCIGRVATAIDNEVSYTWTNGTWYHIAVNRSGTNLQFFVNGTQVGSTGSNSVNYPSQGYRIGSETTQKYFKGYISNFRLVRASVYTTTFTPSTTPLTAITSTAILTCQSNRFIDNSTNNFAITVNGTPSVQRFNPFGTSTAYSTSVIGGSAYFDGSGDYLSVPDDVQFTLTTSDYTMEMWVYPTTFASLNVPFAYGWTSGSGTRLIVFIQNTNGTYQIYYNDASNTFTTTNTVNLNAWNHLALVRNGSNFDFYINGVSSASATNSFSYSDSSFPIVIGSSWSGSTGQYFYTGYISDVRICVGAAVYTSGFTPPTAPLTTANTPALLCKFTNGAIFDNAMMNDLETVGNAQISTSVKKYGTGSLAFDGTGDSLLSTGTQNAAFGTGDFTVEMWLYLNTTGPAYQGVVDTRPNGGASANAFLIYIAGGGTLYYFSNSTNILSYSPISTGAWIHVAVTRSNGSLRLFINGTISGSAVSNTTNLTETRIIIGSSYDNFDFNGYIDDLRLTKGYARYTANFTAPTAAFLDIGPN